MTKRLVLAIALGTGAAACFSSRSPVDPNDNTGECRFSPAGAVPGTTVIAIKALLFQPVEVRIRTGGTVTWVNCETVGFEAHTTTADQGEWSSPSMVAGDGFSHTFPQPGRFTYHCSPHPFMTGAVVVE